MTIKSKILLWFLLPSILIATFTAVFCYFYTLKTVKKNIFAQLEIAADELHEEVCVFLDGKRGRIVDLSSDGYIKDSVKEITRGGNRTLYYTNLLNTYLAVNKQPHDPDILTMFITNLDGRIISSTKIDQIGIDVSGKTFFTETMKRGSYISDIKHSPEFEEEIFFDIAKLLLTRDGLNTIGIIVNRYNGNSFRKITQSEVIGEFGQPKQKEGLGETGDLYIVNRDKLMVTESRFNKDVTLKQIVDTEGVRVAFDNEAGMIGIYSDYRGIPILGVSRYIEEMDWVVLAEKNISEAFAPIKNLRNFTIVMGIVGVMFMVTVALFFAKRITMPITSLVLATGAIAEGNLTIIDGVKTNDEIGTLTTSFNKMTMDLKKFRDDLKQSEERYRDIIENSSEIIYQTSKERFFIGVNKTMLNKLDFTFEDLKRMKVEDIVPDNEREGVMDHVQKVIETGSNSIETVFLTKKGNIVYVEINETAMYDSKNNFIQTRAFVRDITERMKAEDAEKHRKDLRLLSSQIISVQEDERRRISRELHDEVGQSLTAMKINVELMENQIPENLPNIRQRMHDTKDLLTLTLKEIRTLSFELRPSLLDHFGIISAIRGYSKNYSDRTNIKVEVHGENKERYSPEIEILFYRCAQEALNNVAKHSSAKNINIDIVQGDSDLRMYIKDDGKGFEVNEHFEKNINGSSIGLFGMKERIGLMGGSLTIHSEKNKGTKLEILVPLEINTIKNQFSGVNENV